MGIIIPIAWCHRTWRFKAQIIFYKSSPLEAFEPIGGGLKQVEAGGLGVFGVNKNDHIITESEHMKTLDQGDQMATVSPKEPIS